MDRTAIAAPTPQLAGPCWADCCGHWLKRRRLIGQVHLNDRHDALGHGDEVIGWRVAIHQTVRKENLAKPAVSHCHAPVPKGGRVTAFFPSVRISC